MKTTKEMWIEICEWFGFEWKDSHVIAWGAKVPLKAWYYEGARKELPIISLDFLNECEKKLNPLDHQKFCLFLHKSIMGTMDNFDINGTCNLESISRVVKADAEQRLPALYQIITTKS